MPSMKHSSGLSHQARAVLDYLKSGKGLSNLIALTVLGIGSLSSRVSELKRAGYAIVATSARNPTNQKRFSVYRLKEPTKS